jgi:3-methyladenine DNA glycosylase AlkD
MTQNILSALREELKNSADEQTRLGASRYFKEACLFYGVRTTIVHKLAVGYYSRIKSLGKAGMFALCEELLKSDYNEESFIAFDWSYRLHKDYSEEDFAVFEKWIKDYVNNWAKCDTLCNHTVGALVEKYPRFIENLKQWTHSDNRWFRRAAAVTLIIPAKQGKFLPDIFEIADILLLDKDDLVQKGYGWMLKEASVKHQAEVFNFVMKNKAVMPRTALRYAIEKMPVELRAKAMSKA